MTSRAHAARPMRGSVKDRRLRNYKPGLTTYDNNTFMRVWLSP